MRCSGVTGLAEPVRAELSVWTKELSPRRAMVGKLENSVWDPKVKQVLGL